MQRVSCPSLADPPVLVFVGVRAPCSLPEKKVFLTLAVSFSLSGAIDRLLTIAGPSQKLWR